MLHTRARTHPRAHTHTHSLFCCFIFSIMGGGSTHTPLSTLSTRRNSISLNLINFLNRDEHLNKGWLLKAPGHGYLRAEGRVGAAGGRAALPARCARPGAGCSYQPRLHEKGQENLTFNNSSKDFGFLSEVIILT